MPPRMPSPSFALQSEHHFVVFVVFVSLLSLSLSLTLSLASSLSPLLLSLAPLSFLTAKRNTREKGRELKGDRE